MKHIRSSVKGVFLLENGGVPVSQVTDFGEPIVVGSLCVDTISGELYIFKGVNWFNISGDLSSTSGLDTSYIRVQPTKAPLGGLPQGSIPNYGTIQELLDDVFYPFIAPTTSLSSSSLHEKGLVVNKSMNYSITLNDDIVNTREILLNSVVESSVVGNSGIYNSLSNLQWSNSPTPLVLYYPHTYTFRVNFANSSQQNNNILVEFTAPTYYGVLNIVDIDETNVKTLSKVVRKKSNHSNLVFNPTLQRYVYAYPSVYGDLVSVIDNSGFDVTASFDKNIINFTLDDLSVESYNVYVSNGDTTQVNFKNSFNFN